MPQALEMEPRQVSTATLTRNITAGKSESRDTGNDGYPHSPKPS